jgi:hypothetical protein
MPNPVAVEDVAANLPASMPVVVIMECRPSNNIWIDEVWQVSGVTGDSQAETAAARAVRVIHEQSGLKQVLHSGFSITLHADECESYYHNIKSPDPACYVITRADVDDGPPIPFIVTLSFDEAHAYLECEDEVFTVSMPPELYRWTEAYVLKNYVPEKRVKRKRQNWKAAAGGRMESGHE